MLLVLASALPLALAVLTRAHCRATGWASPDQFTHACYSDVPALVATDGAAGAPPGTALLLRALAAVGGSPRGAFDASVLLGAAALAVGVAALVRAAGPRPEDAALLALSPALVASAVVGLDLVAVGCVAAALLAWARERPLVAGLLAGAAASVRPVTALLVLAAVLVAVRERRRRAGVAVAAGALLAVAAATLLAGATGGSSWLRELRAGAGYGSLWLLPSLTGHPLPDRAVLLLWLPTTLALVAAVAVLAARPGARRLDLPAVALLLVGGALVTAPVVPVQATLVVLPLAALAVPRWSAHLPWAAAEVLYATATWLYLYGASVPQRGAPAWLYGALLLVRLAALAWLVVQPLRERAAAGGAGAGGAGAQAALWTSGARGSAAPVVLTRSGRRPPWSPQPAQTHSPPVTERP
ncbi:glycosyltransferase 87 family protein [Quadrisphaera sp. DSM 44207]|uniref:glycosyltransferase 87 family protein n=1 Tax=Quadrisphaera sp. DSM 44207 TaxID=1881057 RepID=UPI000882D4B5|nr:glycosyltransferase 87 family protein [Quadrisphaera sp. DSM 44207]SDQ23652.1 Protein of unknown function [Quadrisphaera sp. DSM 44207]